MKVVRMAAMMAGTSIVQRVALMVGKLAEMTVV
jgi:hypothetical protein